ncbi:MAG: hypothetical protein A2X94_12325 [Bdellovibrionales bacterium GWB1_55_8]|nr:MAG: hypothetical protein A2X94_12325 [Bdellovibrionales bacterium GWB1_55_8]
MPTVLHRLGRWAEELPNMPAQRYKKGGEWKPISAAEFRDRVYHLALFLESRGLTQDGVSCILSANCPQWVHMDLAAMLVGAKSAGLYPNSMPKDIEYILSHTETRFLAVQNTAFFNKLVEAPGSAAVLERLQLVITFDEDTAFSPKAITYKAALEEGRRLAVASGARKWNEYIAAVDAHKPAFIIYTSGTTGNPKGALLSHDNLVFTADAVTRHWRLPQGTLEKEQRLFSFLPLCHIAEKLQNIGVGISCRNAVSFASKFENVSIELPEVQPTLLLSVPRLWEKMMEGVNIKVRAFPPPRKQLAHWALDVGERVANAKYSGRMPSPLDLIQYKIADRIILGKVRTALGLGASERLASGAAALPAYVARWFRRIGLEIMEDFGQTESTGVICMTEIGVEGAGTVGKPVSPIEVKIAEDGEVLCRGRNVFKGYFRDDAATASTLEAGWLHTGDIGEFNERGMLRIMGRKKEVLKTSGGKMVAPLPIEENLKASPLISQVCMVGDGRKYLSALITLAEAPLAELKAKGLANGAVIEDSVIVAEVKKEIEKLNKTLATYEQIKRFSILAREFSIEEGEMTPTLKMKRNIIDKNFRKIIDSMYSSNGNSGD